MNKSKLALGLISLYAAGTTGVTVARIFKKVYDDKDPREIAESESTKESKILLCYMGSYMTGTLLGIGACFIKDAVKKNN